MSPHDHDVRSIVLENYEEEPSILMRLGNVLEKLLTLNKDQFERLKKTSAQGPLDVAAEIYNYSKARLAHSMLIRFMCHMNQASCFNVGFHDSRLDLCCFDRSLIAMIHDCLVLHLI